MAADRLSIQISASLSCSNGSVVMVNDRMVVIKKPGERGGAGVSIPIPIEEWDTIDQKVRAVRAAIQETAVLATRITETLSEGTDD